MTATNIIQMLVKKWTPVPVVIQLVSDKVDLNSVHSDFTINAIVDNAAINIEVHVTLRISIFVFLG